MADFKDEAITFSGRQYIRNNKKPPVSIHDDLRVKRTTLTKLLKGTQKHLFIQDSAVPTKDGTHNLGTKKKRWRNIYVDFLPGTTITKNVKVRDGVKIDGVDISELSNTGYTAGSGLQLSGRQFSLAQGAVGLEHLGITDCVSGELLKVVSGVWDCADDSVTSYTAGNGLTISGTTLSVEPNEIDAAELSGTLDVNQGGTGTTTAFSEGALVFAGSGGSYTQDATNLVWDNTNDRLGIGVDSPSTALDVAGTVSMGKLVGGSGTPSFTLSTGAGSGGTATISGSDLAGNIELTTGTLPALGATIIAVNFDDSYDSPPHVIFSPANAITALLSGITMPYVTSATGNFSLISGTTALTALSTYSWNYFVIE